MRRLFPLLALVVVLMLGIARSPLVPAVHAQDASPTGGPPPEEGVTFTPLGFAVGITLPTPADLLAVRIDLEPGAVTTFNPNDPTSSLLVMESGEITIRVDELAWSISRGDAFQQALATPESGDMAGIFEAVAMGEEATLNAGDVAYVPGSVNGEARNDGQEPASGTIFLVAPGGMLGEAPDATPAS